MSGPAFVLVRPQLGENIGAAARAMLNFGCTDLRLVSPRDGWPNPSAGPAAAGADRVLEGCRVFATTADAVADRTHVYATTVRRREVTKPVRSPAEAAPAMVDERAAVLFGAERSGLRSDDVAIARTILTVPINPMFSSLNLAQAVLLVAYEVGRAGAPLTQPTARAEQAPADQEDLEGMLAHITTLLEPKAYFWPPDRGPVTRRTLRTLLTQPRWTADQVRTFRGVLSALGGPDRERG